MTFAKTIDALNRCGMHRIKPGMERMQVACERLQHPERACPCVHVAGTNGKGSTIAFLESFLRADGYSIGRYTSPHLHEVRERITVNGEMISVAEFVGAYDTVMTSCGDLALSYFEILTLMVFVYFRQYPVDVVLLEVGMGGRWDATNVVTPLVSVITTIDYDHQSWLGETLAQITAEKCGILKPGVPAISAVQPREAMDVFQVEVRNMCLHAQVVPPLAPEIPLGLKGDHQRQNAALAVVAARIVREAIVPSPHVGGSGRGGSVNGIPKAAYTALADTRWPGRLEWVSQDPPILCDVAHNPGGVRTLVEYLKSPPLCKGRLGGVENLPPLTLPYKGGGITCLIGIMSDKDAPGMVKILTEIADTFYCVTPNTDRALPAEKLADVVRSSGKEAVITTIADMKHKWRGPGTLVVTGSFYTVGEFCV